LFLQKTEHDVSVKARFSGRPLWLRSADGGGGEFGGGPVAQEVHVYRMETGLTASTG
jgi:hypothetical protein